MKITGIRDIKQNLLLVIDLVMCKIVLVNIWYLDPHLEPIVTKIIPITDLDY